MFSNFTVLDCSTNVGLWATDYTYAKRNWFSGGAQAITQMVPQGQTTHSLKYTSSSYSKGHCPKPFDFHWMQLPAEPKWDCIGVMIWCGLAPSQNKTLQNLSSLTPIQFLNKALSDKEPAPLVKPLLKHQPFIPSLKDDLKNMPIKQKQTKRKMYVLTHRGDK